MARRKYVNKAFSLIELSVVILVIGILIAGIMEGNSLVRKSVLNSARALTKSSPVNGIKDLFVWYETSLEDSFKSSESEDGSSVTTWYDSNSQVGGAVKNNATLFTAGVYFSENAFGGIPGVYFDGIYGSLSLSVSFLARASFTIFVVEKKASANFTNIPYILGAHNTNGTNSAFFISYLASPSVIRAGLINNYVQYTNANNDLNVNLAPNIHTLVVSKTNGLKYWANGGINPDASDSSKKGPFTGSVSRIGNYFYNYTSSSYAFKGYVAEYIIFSRELKDEERQAVEKYLGQKYGIDVV